jgi:hypothetical protein
LTGTRNGKDTHFSAPVVQGEAVIKGGKPVILDMHPKSHSYSGNNVQSAVFDLTIRLRDGGEPATGSDAIYALIPYMQYSILTNRQYDKVEQTFHSQTYRYRNCNVWEWTANPSHNPYQLGYINSDGIKSVNSIPFTINDWQFEISVNSIRCIEVSSPKLWTDKISFSAFSYTALIGLTPVPSKIYVDFDSGDRILVREDPLKVFYPRRIVEDYLTVTVAIYEHDNLKIIEWVFDIIADFVVNFVINAVADFVAAAITVVTL